MARVQLEVEIPDELEPQLREILRIDPRFPTMVILYGLTRRSIIHHIMKGTTP